MSGKTPRALVLAAACLFAGQASGGPDEVLAQAREKLRATTLRLPDYACIETVGRAYFTSGHQLEATDRVRLEVAVSQGREIHSWPGASRFDTRRAEDIIGDGPVGTGAFGTYLMDIFDNPDVQFTRAAPRRDDPPGTLGYDFRVPPEASHYQVKAGSSWRRAPYAGSFWIETHTLDLVRLTLRVEQLPPESTMAEATTVLDYRTVKIGDGAVLLAGRSELRIRLTSGRETESVTTFSECREYQAESELHFDEDGGADSGGAGAKPAIRTALAVPLGLPLTLAFTAPIDTDKAAAGDLVTARVVKPVSKPGTGEALIPAGALVRGRITRVEHHLLPTPYFLIAMGLDRLERSGTSSPFYAKLDEGEELARRLGAHPAARGRGVERWARGVFLFPTGKSRHVVPAGYESKWMTLATSGR